MKGVVGVLRFTAAVMVHVEAGSGLTMLNVIADGASFVADVYIPVNAPVPQSSIVALHV